MDLEEIAQGLTILCGGSMKDKIEGAIILFDNNNSETLDLDEMRVNRRDLNDGTKYLSRHSIGLR